jgi:2-keto-4-pentenoate hydratase/2-oxohepta-3-ene-1,7-dioic acid hydratase in catechol pathway
LKLANFEKEGTVRAGIVKDNRIFDIAEEAESGRVRIFRSVTCVDQLLDDRLLEALKKAEPRLTAGKGAPLRSVRLRSPVLYPEKIFMVAVNYGLHGRETNTAPPASPYLFTKFRNSLIGPGDAIMAPRSSKQVDWEVELAVVIGREGKNIKRNKAYSYVAGYTVSNDISFRDFQGKRVEGLGMNWVKGKGMDSSFPLGPWLVTRDEIPDPNSLRISLKVNGEQKQGSNTRDMLIKVDELVSYASIGTTLRPGDIISTGTPEGIAAATGEPYLKDGDVVEARIEKIGVLRNPVKDEA